MMQHDHPDDFVIGTGEAHSVGEFLDEAFGYMDWHEYVQTDPRYFRLTVVYYLQADPTKARQVLGWEPQVCFRELVRIMVDADLGLAGLDSPGEGRKILKKHHGPWHNWDDQVISMGNNH
jgi:GDPmannose 4,6-dehydratase